MTCYRTLPPGETLDFMLAGHEFGIPHAPGYPLLTIIGTVSSVFPGWLFGMEYTFQMNMVMCAISSLANVVLFYLVKYITGHTSAGIMARVRSKFLVVHGGYSIIKQKAFEGGKSGALICMNFQL